MSGFLLRRTHLVDLDGTGAPIDAATSAADLESVRRLAARTGTRIVLSSATSRGADTAVESVEDAVTRVSHGEVSRVRWLSAEDPGDLAVVGLDAGVSVDRRPIAAAATRARNSSA